jgi:hypothetical protein
MRESKFLMSCKQNYTIKRKKMEYKNYRVAKKLNATISAVLWDITQSRVVIPYRRFGTNYRYNLQKTLEDGTDKVSRDVCNKLPLYAV